MKGLLSIVKYSLIGLFLVALVASFFLEKLLGDPVEFRLLNNTADTIYVKSSDVDSEHSNLDEIKIDDDLYRIVLPRTELVLLEDFAIYHSEYPAESNLHVVSASLEVMVNGQKRELFMNDGKKYRINSDQSKKVFTREISRNDIE